MLITLGPTVVFVEEVVDEWWRLTCATYMWLSYMKLTNT